MSGGVLGNLGRGIMKYLSFVLWIMNIIAVGGGLTLYLVDSTPLHPIYLGNAFIVGILLPLLLYKPGA